jgi:hypothetical protein
MWKFTDMNATVTVSRFPYLTSDRNLIINVYNWTRKRNKSGMYTVDGLYNPNS